MEINHGLIGSIFRDQVCVLPGCTGAGERSYNDLTERVSTAVSAAVASVRFIQPLWRAELLLGSIGLIHPRTQENPFHWNVQHNFI